jgi:hypothetical protein
LSTENKYTIKLKKRKQISDSVFNLLFKDLVESEKIKLYMDKLTERIYKGEISTLELSKCLSELTDRYVKKGMHQADQASVIRYISAFAKIENNVKANLCAMSVQETPEDNGKQTDVQHIIQQYRESQHLINQWVRQYAVGLGMDPEWVVTPDLEWMER